MSEDNLPRRRFLLGAGLAGTAIATGLTDPIEAQQQPTTPQAAASSPPVQELEPFVTLTASEAAFIVAAVDTLIPADELSPSGSDCGVAVFIDRQLGSARGGGAKMYRAGPFAKGKPEQGYRLSLAPRLQANSLSVDDVKRGWKGARERCYAEREGQQAPA